jgi:NAD(P) transhydrogenase subunit alpha
MQLHLRAILLVLTLSAAQATVATAQVPAASPPMAPATQPAATPRQPVPRPATQAAHTQPKRTASQAAPLKPGPAAEKPAAAEHETRSPALKPEPAGQAPAGGHAESSLDFWSMVFVFMLATFIGVGVIRRVSRLLHTPLMSLTNAISAIAVVGSIMLAGGKHYPNNWYHFWGAVALFASMTNIVSGFLITDRMLKMFKTREGAK